MADWLAAVLLAYNATDVADDELSSSLAGTAEENALRLMRGLSSHDGYCRVHRSVADYARRMHNEGNMVTSRLASETADALGPAFELAQAERVVGERPRAEQRGGLAYKVSFEVNPLVAAEAIAKRLGNPDAGKAANKRWHKYMKHPLSEQRSALLLALHDNKLSASRCAELQRKAGHLAAVREALIDLYQDPKGVPDVREPAPPKATPEQVLRNKVGAILRDAATAAGPHADVNAVLTRMVFESAVRAREDATLQADEAYKRASRRIDATLKAALPAVYKPLLKRLFELEQQVKQLKS